MPLTNFQGNLIFRKACEGDEEWVISLLKLRLAETGQFNEKAESSIDSEGRRLFRQMVNHPDFSIIIGIADETPVATASVYLLPMIRRGGLIAFVEYVFIHPDYRRRGFGKALMATVESHAKKSGAQTIKLSTKIEAGEIHKFYQECGFKATDYLMRKDIK